MTKRMLIDATHAEETRVVVLDGNRLEDFDVESAARKQLKGNIYLAKIVRVEPSLQAAFVEYGGNRHGFLAFGEIHPDYYQIPVADRQRLLAMQAAAARAEAEAEDAPDDAPPHVVTAHTVVQNDTAPDELSDTTPQEVPAVTPHEVPDGPPAEIPAGTPDEAPAETPLETPPETLGGETDAAEEARERRAPQGAFRHYKIQEVIHRRQIMLVQVVKEERGTKGAALTTYISLAGRFCVLMPNSPRGGGVSRKITAPADRKRLKEVIAELDIPDGMGLIVRTAGANRPKAEIKRDCEYLLRLWDDIRETTLGSVAPALIYEEANLIKRTIRDVYARDIEEVAVDGEEGFRAAHDFMRMLMPSHAKKVIAWQEPMPLFAKYQVEAQLDAMMSPRVALKSGGYLVINQAEALVAIDVNSGRSTRERNIEETALRTNLEAAEEVARQLRLRDLAGLIVIDFIDMESKKHNAMVERKLKDALKIDRARIQVGHISHFGLLEMSRQRLRPSLAETSFVACPHCGGTGQVRGTESAAIHVLRGIEEEAAKRRAGEITVRVAGTIAFYILNHKRDRLQVVEARYGLHVIFVADETLIAPQMRIERTRAVAAAGTPTAVTAEASASRQAEAAIAGRAPATADDDLAWNNQEDSNQEGGKPIAEPVGAELHGNAREDATTDDEAPGDETPGDETPGDEARGGEDEEHRRRRRRRRRRGGRREDTASSAASVPGIGDQPEIATPPTPGAPAAPEIAAPTADDNAPAGEISEPVMAETAAAEPKPRRTRRGGRRRRHDTETPAETGADADMAVAAGINDVAPARPVGPGFIGPTPADPFAGTIPDIFEVMERAEAFAAASSAPPATPIPATPEPEPATAPEPEPDAAAEPPEPAIQPIVIGADAPVAEKKRGWWRR